MQTFGVSYEIVNGKTSITKVGDAEFRPEDTYSIATNDFLAEGGDGYDLLKERGSHVYSSSTLITEPLVKLIREKKVIDATVVEHLK